MVYHRFLTGGVEMFGGIFSFSSALGMPLALSGWECGKLNILRYESSSEDSIAHPKCRHSPCVNGME